jgi:CcmD family protein
MGPWGFVSLAYGIVWGTLVVYLVFLRRRHSRATAELDQLMPKGESVGDEKK